MAKGITIPIPIPKSAAGDSQLIVFAFSKNGQLLGKRNVSGGKVQFDAMDIGAQDLRLFIVPAEIPRIESVRNIDSLLKFRPYEPSLSFDKDKITIKPIPDEFFNIWKLRFCSVRGKVQKWFNVYDAPGYKPLCRARVHICEVDKILLWIERIPDDVIFRIPDIILKPEIPIPIPIPRPRPIPIIDPRVISGVTIRPRSADATDSNPFAPLGSTDISATALRALPQVSDVVRRQLLTNNAGLIRKTVLENFNLFHPYFCYHPWFWPYLYRLDELTTEYTDFNGRFEATIVYLEGGDIPDIYCWVEVMINGVWTTVYRPAVPCHTYWDYKCGTEITINVSDERVQWGCQQVLPGEIVWIKSIGHGTSVSRIQQTPLLQPSNNTPAVNYQRIGMADRTEAGDFKNPFGTSIYFLLQFSSGLPNNNVYYYRWKYCRTHNADMQVINANPADADFNELANPVSKSYTFEYIDPITNIKHFDSKSVPLGPKAVGGSTNLYQIPPVSPAMAPFNVPESSPFWDQNTYSIGLDTNGLDGDGLYEFRLELFNKSGVKMNALPKSIYQVPHAATFTPSVVAPDVMQTNPAGAVSQGFDMRVRINNQRCEAAVYKIKLNGTDASADCCGFVKYVNNNADIQIGFKAMHPHNHAEFSFSVQKGTCSDAAMSAATNAGGEVSGHANGYLRDANGIYRKTFKPNTLLGVCQAGGKAAFAEFVHVDALHIDGNNVINGYDASASAAFALEP